VASGIALFAAYAAGMGAIVGTVAVAVALASDGLVRWLRRSGRWLPRVSGGVLLLAGAYVAWYGAWEVRVLRGSSADDPVIDAAAGLQRELADAATAVGPGGWALMMLVLVGLTLLSARWRSSRADARENPGKRGKVEA
jgi:cytochrome c-type biogenesis protein